MSARAHGLQLQNISAPISTRYAPSHPRGATKGVTTSTSTSVAPSTTGTDLVSTVLRRLTYASGQATRPETTAISDIN